MSAGTGVVVWNVTGQSIDINVTKESGSNNYVIKDSSNSLITVNSSSEPKFYYNSVFNNGYYSSTNQMTIGTGVKQSVDTALVIVPANNTVMTLTFNQSSVFGHTFTTDNTSTFTVKYGGLVSFGAPTCYLSNIDGTYPDANISAASSNPGISTLTLNNYSSVVVESGATLHIGAGRIGDGTLELESGTTESPNILTLDSGTTINIGASCGTSVSGTVKHIANKLTIKKSLKIKGSIINIGGGSTADSSGLYRGGTGTVTLGADVTNSKIYCGSGTGAGDSFAGLGGAGTLETTAKIENSLIFLGGAGGPGDSTNQKKGGNGGSGKLVVNNTITDSVVMVGSSGGASHPDLVSGYGWGGGAGGKIADAGNGGNSTLTLKATDGDKVINKNFVVGLPAASGNDVNYNVSCGSIKHSLVMIGYGNFGYYISDGSEIGAGGYIGGGASGLDLISGNNCAAISLGSGKYGYNTQKQPYTFKVGSSQVFSLPITPSNGSQQTFYAHLPETPADCSGWNNNGTETALPIYKIFLEDSTGSDYIAVNESLKDNYYAYQTYDGNRPTTSIAVINPSKSYLAVSDVIAEKNKLEINQVTDPKNSNIKYPVIKALAEIPIGGSIVKKAFAIGSGNYMEHLYIDFLGGLNMKQDAGIRINPDINVSFTSSELSGNLIASLCNATFTGCKLDNPNNLGTLRFTTTFENCLLTSGTVFTNQTAETTNQVLNFIGTNPATKMDLSNFRFNCKNTSKSQDITFKDCIFRTNFNGRLIDAATTTSNNCSVLFKNCDFYNELAIYDHSIATGSEKGEFQYIGNVFKEFITTCSFDSISNTLSKIPVVTDCVFNSGVDIQYSSRIDHLEVENTYVKSTLEEDQEEPVTQMFVANIYNRVLKNVTTTKDFSLTAKDAIFHILGVSDHVLTLSSPFELNLKNEYVAKQEFTFEEPANSNEKYNIDIDNKGLDIIKGHIKQDARLIFSSSCSLALAEIDSNVKLDINRNFYNIAASVDNGITTIRFPTTFNTTYDSGTFNQENLRISNLYTVAGCSLSYDTTEFLTAKLMLCEPDITTDGSISYNPNSSKPISLKIVNNSITNDSDYICYIYTPFSIGKTDVQASLEKPFKIASKATVSFIDNDNSVVNTSDISAEPYLSMIFINGKPLEYNEIDGVKYFKIESGITYTGFSIDIEGNILQLDGSLTTDSEMYLRIGSNITIPKNSSITFTGTGNTLLKGNLQMLGENSLTINNTSAMTIDFGTVSTPVSRDDATDLPGAIMTNSNITLNGSYTNNGSIEFINTTLLLNSLTNGSKKNIKMVYVSTDSNKPFSIVNNGDIGWYNARINPIDNGTITIRKFSSICPSEEFANDALFNVLEFNGSIDFGGLNIVPTGKLSIRHNQPSGTLTFNGAFYVNNIVYLGTDSQEIPLNADTENTVLKINSSAYDQLHPFEGIIKMTSQGSNTATLQINSSGSIRICSTSTFFVSGYAPSQNVIINGSFISSVEGKTFEYQKDLTLNGSLEFDRDVLIRGDLQITSSGVLLIGDVAKSSSEATLSDVVENSSTINDSAIITATPSSDYQTISFTTTEATPGTFNQTTTEQKTYNISSIVYDDENNKYNVTYSNGLVATITITYNVPSPATVAISYSSNSVQNVFFGDSSDVYISGSLQIFGTFYNNGILRVNAKLLSGYGSTIVNNGSILVKGGNDNSVLGTVRVSNGGQLIYNGTYNDHAGCSLTINERGILTVNDSLTLSNATKELIVSSLSDPQVFNALINNDIVSASERYTIKPSNTQQQFVNINVESDLENYKVTNT